MTTESNRHEGNYYTPAAILKTLQEAQPQPAAEASRAPAADPVIHNPPFGTQSKIAE